VPAEQSGTAADQLADAIEAAAGGALRCVPVRGAWTAARVAGLVGRVQAAGGGSAAAAGAGAASPAGAAPRLLANLRTGQLWGTRPPAAALLAHLEGAAVEPPPAEWDVGHFCELAALLRGPGGSLVVVRDSYPSLGWDAHHLQPPDALSRALLRGDGREGGVLVVAPSGASDHIEAVVRDLGLDVGTWDNGTRR
jgi:hypothetical protein